MKRLLLVSVILIVAVAVAIAIQTPGRAIANQQEQSQSHTTDIESLKRDCDNKNRNACFNLAFAYYESEAYDDAIKFFTKSLQLASVEDKLQADANFLISLSYYEIKNYNKAIDYIVKALSIANAINYTYILDSNTYYIAGRISYEAKKYDMSINFFLKSLKFARSNVERAKIHHYMGLIYEDVGKYEDAYKAFKTALEINKLELKQGRDSEDLKGNTAILHRKLAVHYTRQKRYNDALKELEDALLLANEQSIISDIYFQAGYVYLQLKDYNKAIDAYIKSIRAYKSADAYNDLGVAYEESKEYKKAYYAYSKAVELDNNNDLYKKNLEEIKTKIELEDYEIFLDDKVLEDIAYTNIVCNSSNTIDQNVVARYGDLRHIIADARLSIGLESTKNMQTFCNAIARTLNLLSAQQIRKLLYIAGKSLYATQGKQYEKAMMFSDKLPDGDKLYTLIMTKKLYNYSHSVFITRSRYPQYAFLVAFLDIMKTSAEMKKPLRLNPTWFR